MVGQATWTLFNVILYVVFSIYFLCRAFRLLCLLCLVPWNLVVVGFPITREDRRSAWHLRDAIRRGVSRGPCLRIVPVRSGPLVGADCLMGRGCTVYPFKTAILFLWLARNIFFLSTPFLVKVAEHI
jgi:hypothetical protein